MKTIIDNAINELKLKGLEPLLINLTDSDYCELIKECELETKMERDYMDGNIKNISFYKGVQIDSRLPNVDEVDNPFLSDSFISTPNIFQQHDLKMIQQGRMFNLKSLVEINLKQKKNISKLKAKLSKMSEKDIDKQLSELRGEWDRDILK